MGIERTVFVTGREDGFFAECAALSLNTGATRLFEVLIDFPYRLEGVMEQWFLRQLAVF